MAFGVDRWEQQSLHPGVGRTCEGLLAVRATQGVRIINLREGDAIASVMAVPAAGEEEEVQPAEGVETGGETPGAAPAEE